MQTKWTCAQLSRGRVECTHGIEMRYLLGAITQIAAACKFVRDAESHAERCAQSVHKVSRKDRRIPHSARTFQPPKPAASTARAQIRRPKSHSSTEDAHLVTRTALAPQRKGKSVPRKSSPPRRKPKSVAQNPFPPRRNAISAARNAIPPWRNGVMEHVERLVISELRKIRHHRQNPRGGPWNKCRGTSQQRPRSNTHIAPR